MKNRFRVVLILLSLAVAIILFRVNCHTEEDFEQLHSGGCNIEDTVENDDARKMFQDVLDGLKEEFANRTTIIPTENFIPWPGCQAMTPAPCKNTINTISYFPLYHKVTIRLFNCDSVYGAYTDQRQYEISLSVVLLKDSDELRRTIVHELSHMIFDTALTNHGATKNCDYFKKEPLIAEYCFSGKSTFAMDNRPFKLFNSKENNGICIITKQ